MKFSTTGLVLAFGAALALGGCAGYQHTAAAPAAPAAPAAAPATPAAPPPSNPTTNEASHSLVRQVQEVLAKDHLYTSRVDGLWGPHTEAGVRQYQTAHSLPVTGQLDSATLQAMDLKPAE